MPYSWCFSFHAFCGGIALRETVITFNTVLAGKYITQESFRFHDPDVGLLREGNQIIRNIPFDKPFVAPVVWQSDLMNYLAV